MPPSATTVTHAGAMHESVGNAGKSHYGENERQRGAAP